MSFANTVFNFIGKFEREGDDTFEYIDVKCLRVPNRHTSIPDIKLYEVVSSV